MPYPDDFRGFPDDHACACDDCAECRPGDYAAYRLAWDGFYASAEELLGLGLSPATALDGEEGFMDAHYGERFHGDYETHELRRFPLVYAHKRDMANRRPGETEAERRERKAWEELQQADAMALYRARLQANHEGRPFVAADHDPRRGEMLKALRELRDDFAALAALAREGAKDAREMQDNARQLIDALA